MLSTLTVVLGSATTVPVQTVGMFAGGSPVVDGPHAGG